MTAPAPDVPRRNFVGRLLAAFAGGVLLARARAAAAAPQGFSPFIGEIRIFGGNFAPVGWAFCDGQSLAIADNTALFQLIGTTYGGDGFETFNLPDLRSRVPIHQGTSTVGTSYVLGQWAGTEAVFLSVNQLPAHTHVARASAALGTSDTPTGRVPARSAAGTPQYATTADSNLAPGALLGAGGLQTHDNLQPYLGVSFIISLDGIYPSP